jgi:hypothetical protein
MVIKVEKRNLFDVDSDYYFAHCISSDCAMGAGIAVDFQKKFHLRNYLLSFPECRRKPPTIIYYNRVFNLITKAKYWHKPTYESLMQCLVELKKQCIDTEVKYLAMPKIGCGLDRLQWGKVKEIIEQVFSDTEIEILVCYL